MTDDKIRKVLNEYDRVLRTLLDDLDPVARTDQFGRTSVRVQQLQHLGRMLPTMLGLLRESHEPTLILPERAAKREKLMRWLGFMQGVMWTQGLYTIDELRSHNMPDGETFRPRATPTTDTYEPDTPRPDNG